MPRTKDQVTRFKDRIARYVISAGGVFVLTAMIGILVYLFSVVYPLFLKVKVKDGVTLPNVVAQIISPDVSGLVAVVLDSKQGISMLSLKDGITLLKTLQSPELPWISVTPINQMGKTLIVDGKRNIHIGTVRIAKPLGELNPQNWAFEEVWIKGPRIPSGVNQILDFSISQSFGLVESTNFMVAAQTSRGVKFFKFAESDDTSMSDTPIPQDIVLQNNTVRAGLFSDDGARFYVLTSDGRLQNYSLEKTPKLLAEKVFSEPQKTMSFLLGGRTLLLGGERGSVSAVQWVRTKTANADEVYTLDQYHTYPSLNKPILGFAASPEDKRFLVWSEDDSYVAHATSEKIIRLNARIVEADFEPNGKSLWVQSNTSLKQYLIDDEHSEITLDTLTQPIQYEGYATKEYVWQSSSATDDNEHKFNLMPLIFGTIKSTLYALLFAVPIAVLGALYTSQFASRKWVNIIKPTIELMAALPSVVLGFIGGLVMAPYFQKMSVSVFILIPVAVFIFIILLPLWVFIPESLRRRLSSGSEFLWCIPVLVIAYLASIQIAPIIETKFFGANFVQYLLTNYNLTFDQRNSLVLGFVLGFAVIPLIYTISEDALTSVPRSLTSASLACGASKWQTAWRIVLPTASPGIFSAIMIGIGRAVGETMIVLMATGNTPIMDWSGFNGLRSMAANIAVEMPEAPLLGTHYRILFLSALLLFIFTLLLNTIADIVSSNLRKKYESL